MFRITARAYCFMRMVRLLPAAGSNGAHPHLTVPAKQADEDDDLHCGCCDLLISGALTLASYQTAARFGLASPLPMPGEGEQGNYNRSKASITRRPSSGDGPHGPLPSQGQASHGNARVGSLVSKTADYAGGQRALYLLSHPAATRVPEGRFRKSISLNYL